MRFTQAVRGGQLALWIGFAFLNFASASSLTYFYGYSSPGLAAWQAEDSFGSQNVKFVPQTSMVSQSGGMLDTFASSFGTSYAYSPFGSSSAFSTASTTQSSLATGFQSFSMGSSYSALTSYGGGSSTGYSSSLSNYSNVNGLSTWNAWMGGSDTSAPAQSMNVSGWAPVSFATMAPVTSNFTSPTVTPAIITPTTPNFDIGFENPEPATLGLMAAGLAGLFWFRRRRHA